MHSSANTYIHTFRQFISSSVPLTLIFWAPLLKMIAMVTIAVMVVTSFIISPRRAMVTIAVMVVTPFVIPPRRRRAMVTIGITVVTPHLIPPSGMVIPTKRTVCR